MKDTAARTVHVPTDVFDVLIGWEYTHTRLDCCSIFFHRLSPTSPLSAASSSAPLSLSSVSSVSHPLPLSARLPSTEEWFNVQLDLSKAINTRSVMIPADLPMELLILLSLLPPPPPSSYSFLFLRHNISGLFSLDPSPRAPFVVRVLSVPCCSSNKNRDEGKRKKKKNSIKR